MAKEKVKIELDVALTERNCYFEQLQYIYECSKGPLHESTAREEFLSTSTEMEHIRDEFKKCVYTCNKLTLQLNPDVPLADQSLKSFNELYSRIRYARDQLTASTSKLNTSINRTIRLPPMELSSFDGEIKSWSQFYATFHPNVHENLELSDEEKLYYLLSKLTGKAKSIVAGIIPDGKNYHLMYKTLTERFQNKRLLATTYLNQILNFKPSEKSSLKNLETFLDNFVGSYEALKNLHLEDPFDFVMLHLASRKMDSEIVSVFEFNNTEPFPTFQSFIDCIRRRFRVLENIGSNQSIGQRKSGGLQTHTFLTGDETQNCLLCDDNKHQLVYRCPKFLESTPEARFSIAKQLNLCLNCLKQNCKVKSCNSQNSCRTCNKKHHTLIHFEIQKPTTSIDQNNIASGVSLCSTMERRKGETILLGTAILKVRTIQGKWNSVRALIDCASQQDYITEACVKRLDLKILSTDHPGFVLGFGGTKSPVLGRTNITVHSRHDSDNLLDIYPLVVNRISNRLPTSELDISRLQHLSALPLADSGFGIPRDVDMLIGARSFPFILKGGRVTTTIDVPSALETIFGYIVIGAAPLKNIEAHCQAETSSFCAVDTSIDTLLTKFRELENVPDISTMTPNDSLCENIYTTTTSQNDNGVYSVKLPSKGDPYSLGNPCQMAKPRFLALEKRVSPTLKRAYDEVIEEHLEKGYLSVSASDSFGYYIPHHAVIREDKSSTKLCIVLDASAKTDNDLYLNDVLHGGRSLQIDLFTILLNLRLSPIVVSADIKQMYLQIRFGKDHRRFQQILYRFDQYSKLDCYEYNYVTFGMKCSPFLALRTIRQLAADEEHKFPLASIILNRDIYMDDVASSVGSEQEAIEVSKQLIFHAGGFDLVKFLSNSAAVLESVPETSRLSKNIKFEDKEYLKVLGMCWIPAGDVFAFKVDTCGRTCTRRGILSTTAGLWDIMGFVASVILYAKLLLRTIWRLKLDWDETLPDNIRSIWNDFLGELPLLENYKLPRHLGVNYSGCTVTIVGFADTSEKAYEEAVYLHVKRNSRDIIVNLLCAESRVAPLNTISLARLELCGVLILSKLIHSVVSTYSSRHELANVIAFSDSTVALNWIYSSPHRWETFVANRVAKVQEFMKPEIFHHIDRKNNPADCLSTDLTPSQLTT